MLTEQGVLFRCVACLLSISHPFPYLQSEATEHVSTVHYCSWIQALPSLLVLTLPQDVKSRQSENNILYNPLRHPFKPLPPFSPHLQILPHPSLLIPFFFLLSTPPLDSLPLVDLHTLPLLRVPLLPLLPSTLSSPYTFSSSSPSSL